jgi:hypothetical protein
MKLGKAASDVKIDIKLISNPFMHLNTRKMVPMNLPSWEKPRKLDAAEINTFTVYTHHHDITEILLKVVLNTKLKE